MYSTLALIFSVSPYHFILLQILLDAGADTEATGKCGNSPLIEAASR